MGETNIEWTDYTFNPWRGCRKVSEGCKNCYAEFLVSTRHRLKVWGQDAPRQVAAESTWRGPVRWNNQARKDGVRKRVFCASLADIFEDYSGPSAADIRTARLRLWSLIQETPNLIWLLLTKRPEMVRFLAPDDWHTRWPSNVWIGCTVENQQRAEERVPRLLEVPAPVRFVSYEPALEAVDFTRWFLNRCRHCGGELEYCDSRPGRCQCMSAEQMDRAVEDDRWRPDPQRFNQNGIDWLIVGGESGPGARQFNPAWADWTINQCRAAGIPVFVKQMGSSPTLRSGSGWGPIRDRKGGDMTEWSKQLRVRELPTLCGAA